MLYQLSQPGDPLLSSDVRTLKIKTEHSDHFSLTVTLFGAEFSLHKVNVFKHLRTNYSKRNILFQKGLVSVVFWPPLVLSL